MLLLDFDVLSRLQERKGPVVLHDGEVRGNWLRA